MGGFGFKPNRYLCVTDAWFDLLVAVLGPDARTVGPRGRQTRELLHAAVAFDLNYPVLTSKARKLNYRFAAAEARWILSGSRSVSDIASYNKNIAQFSDDGEIFNGAYGPPVIGQLPFVVNRLTFDRQTRQAVLTIWRPGGVCAKCQNPIDDVRHRDLVGIYDQGVQQNHEFVISKDVPCTVALAFNLREGASGEELNCHVLMRSNDLWLGFPYDMLNFSMIAATVAGRLTPVPALGTLYYTGISCHLYEDNREAALEVLNDDGRLYNIDPVSREVIESNEDLLASLTGAADKTDTPYHSVLPWYLRPRELRRYTE